MSRTEQDWQDARQVAIEVKRHIEAAMTALDNYPYPDTGEHAQRLIESALHGALASVNTLIGASTMTWACPDSQTPSEPAPESPYPDIYFPTNGDAVEGCQATPQDGHNSHESDRSDTA